MMLWDLGALGFRVSFDDMKSIAEVKHQIYCIRFEIQADFLFLDPSLFHYFEEK